LLETTSEISRETISERKKYMEQKKQLSQMGRWQLWLGTAVVIITLLTVVLHTYTTTKAHADQVPLYQTIQPRDHSRDHSTTSIIYSVMFSYIPYGAKNVIPVCTIPDFTPVSVPILSYLEVDIFQDSECKDEIINLPGVQNQRLVMNNVTIGDSGIISCTVDFFPNGDLKAKATTDCGSYYSG
jgi:hypothetical protein